MTDFIHSDKYYNEFAEIFDIDEISGKKQNERLAEIISSRVKDVKDLFIKDFEDTLKSETDAYLKRADEMIEVLLEYTLSGKRGTPEEAAQRALKYDEAARIIEKIGQRCRDKIEKLK